MLTEIHLEPIEIGAFGAFTLGILVYFLGARMTRKRPILQRYSIPEPVSGGLTAAIIALGIVYYTGREITYDLKVRDFLLVYFFTTVGLNARISDLVKGGPILAILLGLTIGCMFIQNLVGVAGSVLFGLPPQAGVLVGTASLIGGHGTAIAWGPTIQSQYGIEGAAELGIAAATVGLILASVLGGPIAKFLIERNNLASEPEHEGHIATAAEPHENDTADGLNRVDDSEEIDHTLIMRSILWIHSAIALGYLAFEALEAAGIKLPLFVPCLLSAIVLANLLPVLFPKQKILCAQQGDQSHLGVQSLGLSGDVSDEHATLDPWIKCWCALRHHASTGYCSNTIYRLAGIPSHGKRLLRKCDLSRLCRFHSWRNTDGDRQYDCGDPAVRAFTGRVHCAAAHFCLFRRSGQCIYHSMVPDDLVNIANPSVFALGSHCFQRNSPSNPCSEHTTAGSLEKAPTHAVPLWSRFLN